jgi:NDP-sugar pyrophosphorylase family protein
MVVKAPILAAGKGTRLGISTKTRNKCMLRVGGFPLITEQLRRASQLQVTEALVVVGHFGESIKSYFGGVFDGLPKRYFYQRELNGPVGAMQCVASELKEDFVPSFCRRIEREIYILQNKENISF